MTVTTARDGRETPSATWSIASFLNTTADIPLRLTVGQSVAVQGEALYYYYYYYYYCFFKFSLISYQVAVYW
jgi:hypothetical protein